MRLLTLVRHAKSSWKQAGLSDFERPLNERGRRDAPVMAQRALRLFGQPQRLITSPALRAITTAQVFAEFLGVHPHDIVIRPKIYEATAETLLGLLREFDERDGHVMLFGHNPGLSQLAHQLAPCDFDDLPTCGIAHLSLGLRDWRDAHAGCASLLRFTYPKEKLAE